MQGQQATKRKTDGGDRALRLFVGTLIELPERKSIDLFQKSNIELKLENGATIKWSAGHKLHITWCFLGDVDDNKVSLVKEGIKIALQELESRRGDTPAAGSLIFTHMAFWPKAEYPHIIVLRPDSTDKYFSDLANLVRAKTQPFLKTGGEQKDFKAHITLARVPARQARQSVDGISDDTAADGLEDTAEDKSCSEDSRLSGLKFRGQEQLFPLEVKINKVELIESNEKLAGGYRLIENFDLI